MSVSMHLETLDGVIHPTYLFEHAGARQLLKIIDDLPCESRLNNIGGGDVWQGAEWVYRPSNVESFRTAILERIDFNHQQWKDLCLALKDNPDYWIYFSV